MRSFGIFVVLFSLFLSKNLYSNQDNQFVEALAKFKLGEYQSSLTILNNIKTSQSKSAAVYYLKGLCYNKTQAFDQSILNFEKAIKLRHSAKDIYYEYGQALYANSDLEEAKKVFLKSALLNFKPTTSYYYVAYINQLLEQHKEAKNYYAKVIQLEKDDKDLIQVARFQLVDSLLAMAEEKNKTKELVEKYIIKQLDEAIEESPKSSLVKDIKKRKQEIQRQYGLDPNLMINGKTLPEKRWSISFDQDLSYDNNVTQSTDLPSSQATQKDSFIFNSNLNVENVFNPNNYFILTPSLGLKKTKHSDEVNSAVYQNDSVTISPSLSTSYEHKAFGEQASLSFNIDLSQIRRDRNSKQELEHYARTYTFSLGEKFKFFSIGKTGFKIKYKQYTGWQAKLHNRTGSFSVDQLFITPNKKVVIFFAQADFIDNYNDRVSSTNSYLFRGDYIHSNIFENYTLMAGLSTTFLDTKKKNPTRGTEMTFTPSLKISKSINNNLKSTFGYEYTKNYSDDKSSFFYSKHVTTFNLKVSF